MTPQERAEFIADIAEAMSLRQIAVQLSEEEISYVRLAIQREAQSIKLRQAVIEKTFAGLVWAVLAGGGFILLDFARTHGFKI